MQSIITVELARERHARRLALAEARRVAAPARPRPGQLTAAARLLARAGGGRRLRPEPGTARRPLAAS